MILTYRQVIEVIKINLYIHKNVSLLPADNSRPGVIVIVIVM